MTSDLKISLQMEDSTNCQVETKLLIVETLSKMSWWNRFEQIENGQTDPTDAFWPNMD